mmetsp:Transcript_34347/g.33553  ORF Transcript_34347/g.33553 Transcript_34347/m.33553 type:complete len:84 (-) Transcript_34347:48-299(-)
MSEDLNELYLMPYQSPVHPKHFARLGFNLLFIGFFLLSWFLIYVINTNVKQRSIMKEILVAFFSSIFTGFGLIFMIMWFGIYL